VERLTGGAIDFKSDAIMIITREVLIKNFHLSKNEQLLVFHYKFAFFCEFPMLRLIFTFAD